MDPIYSASLGLLLGLSLAAPPGPINAMIANESLNSFQKGFLVGLGAMTADAIFFFLTYYFERSIPLWILKYLYILGSLVMLFLAYKVLKTEQRSIGRKGNYLIGLSVGITNPYQILWWLTAGISMINLFSIYMIPGFFAGILIWIITFPFMIWKVSSRFKIQRFVKIFSFSILAIFSFMLAYQGFNEILNG